MRKGVLFMSNYPANGWQDFSLKKDIEKLLKFLKAREITNLLVLFDLSLVILGVTLDRVFDVIPEKEKIRYLIVMTVLCAFPLVVIIIRGAYLIVKGRQIKRMSAREMIDMFDNEICYYLMMSQSFYDLFCQTQETDKNKKSFYFIEMCFYRNKTMDKLFKTFYKISAVYTDSADIMCIQKKISIARLYNLIDTLDEIEIYIKKNIHCIEHLKNYQSILEVNEINKENLDIFIDEVNNIFNIK